ncbi:MAG: LysM peptidoglycan-binding domain-containing protein [Candidatus Limnocylindrales bacterium]
MADVQPEMTPGAPEAVAPTGTADEGAPTETVPAAIEAAAPEAAGLSESEGTAATAPIPEAVTTEVSPSPAEVPATSAEVPTIPAEVPPTPTEPPPSPEVVPATPDAPTPDALEAEVGPTPAEVAIRPAEMPVAAAAGRGRRLRRWLGTLLGVALLLVAAAAVGYGAAFLVPRFVDASPPAGTLPASATPSSAAPSQSASAPPSASPSGSAKPSGSARASASPGSSPLTYVVQRGDTLASIATRFGVTVQAIVAANSLADPNHIETGQHLIIPRP